MPQQEQERQSRVITRPSNREPRRFRVSVLNDDFTTFEFVIMVMMTVFNKSMAEAEEIAETTHIHQKSTVGVYSLAFVAFFIAASGSTSAVTSR